MKANATLSGHAAARNPLFPSWDTLDLSSELLHPGLVKHPTLSPSTQVQILSVVDVTGSASIEDIIAALPGHGDPVGAIFALVAANVLMLVTTGIVDANSLVMRSNNRPGGKADHFSDELERPNPETGNVSSKASETAAGSAANASIVNYASFVEDSLPQDLLLLPASTLKPKIVMGPGCRRAAFRHVPALQRHGVYFMLRGEEAYTGFGTDVGARIALGRQMPQGAPDTIIAIVDAEDGLSEDDARALERMLWSSVSNDAGYTSINGVPDGAHVHTDRYAELALFVAQVVLTLRQAGVMFLDGSTRDRLAGPRTEPDRLGCPRRFDALPNGRVRELNYCGLTALAAERDDGTWLLLRGSEVRIETVNSASASASFQRAAWLYAGLLELANDASYYVVKRDLVFSSGSAVGHFCSGSKGFGLSAWRSIEPEEDELHALVM